MTPLTVLATADPSWSSSPAVRTRTRRPLPLRWAVAATVCLLPFIVPTGPGNTTLADVAMAAAMALAVLWVGWTGLPLTFPYAVGMGGLVLGGAIAANLAGGTLGTGVVLVQDVVLLLWAATLTLGRHDPAVVGTVVRAWALTAVVFSTVMVFAYLAGMATLAGVDGSNGVRASYTFKDPNLAASYLVVSLVVMAASQRPRPRVVRWWGYLVVLLAIAFTGSNGGILSLLVGLVIMLLVSRLKKDGPRVATLLLALVMTGGLVAVLVVAPRVDIDALRFEVAQMAPLLRDSVARSGDSGGERALLLEEGGRLWFSGAVTGVGPGRTKYVLQESQAPYVKEAHNDYLATLLERGIIGGLGLLALVGAMVARCTVLVTGSLPRAFADHVPRAWLLVAVTPVMLLSANFYEVLHFRHLWTWLGLLAALSLASVPSPARRGGDR